MAAAALLTLKMKPHKSILLLETSFAIDKATIHLFILSVSYIYNTARGLENCGAFSIKAIHVLWFRFIL